VIAWRKNLGSPTTGTVPNEYDLKIDSQVEKFLDLKQKLTYFLITASVGPIAFALSFVKDETKNISGIWIAMATGVVIGLLAAGFALFSLHFELTSYQKHLRYRYERKSWADLTAVEQSQWNKINARAHTFLKFSFIALFAEIAVLAVSLMILLHTKTRVVIPATDKRQAISPESAKRTVQMFDASGSIPAFVQGSATKSLEILSLRYVLFGKHCKSIVLRRRLSSAEVTDANCLALRFCVSGQTTG
jgi:hypothetical protein